MKKKIIWLFYLLFAICFTFTAINIILHNTYYKALHLICVTTICLVGLTIIYKNLWYRYVYNRDCIGNCIKV